MVSSLQTLLGIGVGVAMSVGVGVATSIDVGVAMAASVGVGVATCGVAELIMGTVEVGRTVLVEGERSKSKLTTTLPLEQITNILSGTSNEGLVSAEYSSDTLGSPQSNKFPESWL